MLDIHSTNTTKTWRRIQETQGMRHQPHKRAVPCTHRHVFCLDRGINHVEMVLRNLLMILNLLFTRQEIDIFKASKIVTWTVQYTTSVL